MPELPEVEVVCRGIEPHLVRQRITNVIIRNPRLRWPIPNNLEKCISWAGNPQSNTTRKISSTGLWQRYTDSCT